MDDKGRGKDNGFSLKFWRRRSRSRDREPAGLLRQPWRNFESGGKWDREYRDKLLDEINKLEINVGGIQNIRIVLLGAVKAGKSSFINTVASIDKGRLAEITRSGGADASLTFAFKEYIPKERLKNICLLDTMGLEDSIGGMNVKDIEKLVNGYIRPDYKFNPVSPIDETSSGFRSDPKRGDETHCVVFVVDANILGQDNVSGAFRMKIKAVHEQLELKDIPTFVLITKIDMLCEHVEKDVQKTFYSEKVKKAVDIAEELYHVPKKNIFVVKNYESGPGCNVNIEILALLALRQMAYFGADYQQDTTASGGN